MHVDETLSSSRIAVRASNTNARRKESSGRTVVAIAVVVAVLVAVVGWHDGLIGATSIADMNNGDTPNGVAVTIKGRLTLRFGNVHAISTTDGNHWTAFEWSSASPP